MYPDTEPLTRGVKTTVKGAAPELGDAVKSTVPGTGVGEMVTVGVTVGKEVGVAVGVDVAVTVTVGDAVGAGVAEPTVIVELTIVALIGEPLSSVSSPIDATILVVPVATPSIEKVQRVTFVAPASIPPVRSTPTTLT